MTLRPTPQQILRNTGITLAEAKALDPDDYAVLVSQMLNEENTLPWPVLCHRELIHQTYATLSSSLRRAQSSIRRREQLAAAGDERAAAEMNSDKPARAARFRDLVCMRLDYVTAMGALAGIEFPSWGDAWNLDVAANLIKAIRVLQRLDGDPATTDEQFDKARDDLYALADPTARLAGRDTYLVPVPEAA